MIRFGLVLVLTAFSSSALFAQKAPASKGPVKNSTTTGVKTTSPGAGYSIPITLTPFKNQWIYLGCYFGKYKNLSDSAWVNEKSQGVFKGNKKLPQGIYFVVSPARVLLFEVLIDKDQHFSIVADSSRLNSVTITGSQENTIFQDYTKFLVEKTPKLNALHSQLEAAATKADSTVINEALAQGNKELQDYRENVIKQHPNSMLTAFFHTMKRPDVPQIPVDATGKADSAYPYRFVKEHWWDGVSFDNEALVRTPFFEPKLEEYFKYYVVPDADSIIPEVNYMLLLSRTVPEMHKYLLGKFTDKYINPEYMGQEKVFLFLFDKYFSKGDTAWLGEKQKRYIFDRAYSLMANQLGEPAAELNMLDTSGKNVSLYGLEAPYTFITFWDPNCGHCKEMVPRIDSMYQAKWKAQGVKMVGVNMDDATLPEWKKIIRDQKLGWTHIYQPRAVKDDEAKRGIANFRQLYDVFKTPTLYLLDKDKRIIGKMLSLEQFDEVLQAKIKGKATK
jgi:thiol-disulfide isomerase/thioredoxin